MGALGLLAETIGDETDPEVIAPAVATHDRTRPTGRAAPSTTCWSSAASSSPTTREPERLRLPDVVERGRVPDRQRRGAVPASSCAPTWTTTRCWQGDRRQLISALFNLLDNAVKYSPDGGEVEVRAGRPAGDGRGATWSSRTTASASPGGRWTGSSSASTGSTGPRSRNTGGHGPGPGHRPPRGQQPRGRGDGGLPRGPGQRVHPRAAVLPSQLGAATRRRQGGRRRRARRWRER